MNIHLFRGLILTLAMLIYAIGQGATQALTWQKQQRKDGGKSGRYHAIRVVEMAGLLGLALGFTYNMYCWRQIIIRFFGLIFFGFLIYRLTFIRVRGQTDISPPWDWDISIFGKTYYIKYPPRFVIIGLGIIGLLVNFIKF